MSQDFALTRKNIHIPSKKGKLFSDSELNFLSKQTSHKTNSTDTHTQTRKIHNPETRKTTQSKRNSQKIDKNSTTDRAFTFVSMAL